MSPPVLKSLVDPYLDEALQPQVLTYATETTQLCDMSVKVDSSTPTKQESVECDKKVLTDLSKSEEFLVKYGDEVVPLVKGKVKRQTQGICQFFHCKAFLFMSLKNVSYGNTSIVYSGWAQLI